MGTATVDRRQILRIRFEPRPPCCSSRRGVALVVVARPGWRRALAGRDLRDTAGSELSP